MFLATSLLCLFLQKETINPIEEKRMISPVVLFNRLNDKIRDQSISTEEAKKEIIRLIPQIKKYYAIPKTSTKYVFPVQGYTYKNIGGKNGNGYLESGYDYYKGNSHGGHAAQDIFIKDKNQDNIDDKTKMNVNVLSMSDGIVVAVADKWETNSNLKGGKYIWIYEPSTSNLFYYAHNDSVNVGIGSIVNAGNKIATVGRTGLNAYKKRSPTHLHISTLKVNETTGDVKPFNPYELLKKAK